MKTIFLGLSMLFSVNALAIADGIYFNEHYCPMQLVNSGRTLFVTYLNCHDGKAEMFEKINETNYTRTTSTGTTQTIKGINPKAFLFSFKAPNTNEPQHFVYTLKNFCN